VGRGDVMMFEGVRIKRVGEGSKPLTGDQDPPEISVMGTEV
jgi:hypothetical protein